MSDGFYVDATSHVHAPNELTDAIEDAEVERIPAILSQEVFTTGRSLEDEDNLPIT